jgi:hypothetical protein
VSAVEASLVVVALASGVTGAWSPCGFSMVDTIGLSGHRGGRPTTLAACATFAFGAVVGGAVTFGALGALGGLVHGVGAGLAYLVAAAIAVAAAALEMRGTPILPQIRRQLPEPWRWWMPLPLAAGLYGVLLGLGFTTFVLTFAVWALAGVSFALGDWQTGLAIGIAFGVGRALPVVLLAPSVDRPWAIRVTEMMAERPGIYRSFRLGDAAALLVAAASLTVASAAASNTAVRSGADPSALGRALAYQLPNQRAVLSDGRRRVSPPGTDPALSGSYLATITGGDRIRILRRPGLTEIGSTGASGVDALAISNTWLVYRVSGDGRDALLARNIRNPSNPGPVRRLAGISRPAQLGAPSIDGNRVVYAVARRGSNAIAKRVLGSRSHGVVVFSRTDALSSPSLRGDRLLYVRVHRKRNSSPQSTSVPGLRQSLMLKHLGHHGSGRRIYSRNGDDATLWSTSLTGNRAYATVFGGGRQRIISVRP